MTRRITEKNLYSLLETINRTAGNDTEPYTMQSDGTLRSNVGTYVLDGSYGGWRLCQIVGEQGGERDITGRGNNRETYDAMQAFLKGLEHMQAKLNPEFLCVVSCRKEGAQGKYESKPFLFRAPYKAKAMRDVIEYVRDMGYETQHVESVKETGV